MASGIGLVVAGPRGAHHPLDRRRHGRQRPRGDRGRAPAATAAWNIGTELLTTLAWSTIFVGIPAIIVGLLLGPYGWAQGAARADGRLAHDRPEFLYGGAVLIVLFLIIWEPVPATRRLLTILVFLAVIVGGAYALRKLTSRRTRTASSPSRAAVRASRIARRGRRVGEGAVSRPPAEAPAAR